MVCSIGQAADAAYYMECQQSYRPADSYYVGGEEPDGVWFNPSGLFDLADGGKVETADWMALYSGFSPVDGSALTQNAGKEGRSAGLDMTFSADKTVSALWAVADPELRAEIERAHNDAARTALEEIVVAHCGHTRIRTRERGVEVVAADLMAATFQHGSSRANDPQLHTHCVILNVARAHFDGEVPGGPPVPALPVEDGGRRDLPQRAGVEPSGAARHPDGALRRAGRVHAHRRDPRGSGRGMVEAAADDRGGSGEERIFGEGQRVAGGADEPVVAGAEGISRQRFGGAARTLAERGGSVRRERPRDDRGGGRARDDAGSDPKLTETLEKLPADLAREEAVFRLPDIVERVQNATAGLLDRDAIATCLERALRHEEIVRMDKPEDSADAEAGLAHTRTFSTKAHVGMEEEIREMAEEVVCDAGFAVPAQEIEAKIERLLKDGYPLSEEQTEAIRHAAGRAGRVTIIEGAAGKTTALRPVADLYRDRGYRLLGAAVAWRTAVALGNDCEIPPHSVARLLRMAVKGQLGIDGRTVIFVDEAEMLSVRQAYSLMRLSKLTGAKILWAGDIEQQQPVEAGPGLRLVRDVAGSGVGGAEGLPGGGGGRRVGRARAVSSRGGPGERADGAGRRLGPLPARESGQVDDGSGAHARGGGRALLPDAGARPRRTRNGRSCGSCGGSWTTGGRRRWRSCAATGCAAPRRTGASGCSAARSLRSTTSGSRNWRAGGRPRAATVSGCGSRRIRKTDGR